MNRGTAEAGAHVSSDGRAIERLVVWPNRSLGYRGTALLLGAVAVFFVVIAAWAVTAGAWPMAVYAGLALAGFTYALSCSSRSGRRLQVIELADDRVRVSQLGSRGEQLGMLEFNPYWARVVEVPGPWDDTRVLLRQSGRSVEIGAFLSREERAELAAELRSRLMQRYARRMS